MAEPIRLLIVDDSPFMRRAISSLVDGEEDIKVVGTAKDGQDAIRQINDLKPDIATMDIEMPVMDGLTALKIIMEKCPIPIIMLSSLTEEGAKETLDALDLGAADYIPKNLSNVSLNILKVKDDLISKIRAITAKKYFFKPYVKELREHGVKEQAVEYVKGAAKNNKIDIVAIGSSTGGPKALQDVIPKLPQNFPVPIILVQHMPKAFTGPFAERLSSISHIKVIEAAGGEIIKPGTAYLSPGDKHLSIIKEKGLGFVTSLSNEPEDLINRPSVSVMMESVAKEYPGKALGVILTGMGSDGLLGMKKIKETGGKTIAQNEATCVVYGMPKAVVDAGLADVILPIYKIGDEIIKETV
ncbi:MAG: chemotaxis response regulator protein-glutamate methylesterase [Deltaproteobacteria bacterium]|nr:chemotaxis response regulator protein-glutamate methylesterase [Deltaproteobacteria bacterium]